jgi:formyl-CoA transferase
MGNDNFTAAPSGTFRTKDGYINIAANQQQQWEDLCDVVGAPELKSDARFQARDTRKKNRKLLTPMLEEKLALATTEHWVEALNAKGIPSGAIATLEEALTSPQIQHRGTIQEIDGLQLFNVAAKFCKTPGKLESAPPRLSQHTDEILSSLGYGSEAIEKLRAARVV